MAIKYIRFIWFSFLICFLVTGCSTHTIDENAPAAASVNSQTKGSLPEYSLDFGDVLIPAELKVVKNGSFIYRTSNYSAGVLVYKGRVVNASLIKFFETNMPKDGWSLVCAFKSERSVLLFQKSNKWCIVNITDRTGGVDVEIWVAPSLKDISELQGQEGLLNG